MPDEMAVFRFHDGYKECVADPFRIALQLQRLQFAELAEKAKAGDADAATAVVDAVREIFNLAPVGLDAGVVVGTPDAKAMKILRRVRGVAVATGGIWRHRSDLAATYGAAVLNLPADAQYGLWLNKERAMMRQSMPLLIAIGTAFGGGLSRPMIDAIADSPEIAEMLATGLAGRRRKSERSRRLGRTSGWKLPSRPNWKRKPTRFRPNCGKNGWLEWTSG